MLQLCYSYKIVKINMIHIKAETQRTIDFLRF